MAAVALDANNGLFPLAYDVVEGETRNSWEWFLNFLQSVIGDFTDEKP